LDDVRTLMRYAELTLNDAARLAPDKEAAQAANELREEAVLIRKHAMTVKVGGLTRFNPRRART
jgi:hypothetical protein